MNAFQLLYLSMTAQTFSGVYPAWKQCYFYVFFLKKDCEFSVILLLQI